MKMGTRKIYAILLTLALVIAMLPANVAWGEDTLEGSEEMEVQNNTISINSFIPLNEEILTQSYETGTIDTSAIKLPTELTGITEAGESIPIPVTWAYNSTENTTGVALSLNEFNTSVEGTYAFTPTVTGDYQVDNGSLPKVSVTLTAPKMIENSVEPKAEQTIIQKTETVTNDDSASEYRFDIAKGRITIEKGTEEGTLQISQGTSIEDNISNDKEIIIYQSAEVTNNTIEVIDGVMLNLTLEDVNIDYSKGSTSTNPLNIRYNSKVNLTLKGNNILKGCNLNAAISVLEGCTLIISSKSTGTLDATGGASAAGIGGNADHRGEVVIEIGTITIEGGIIKATGGVSAVGIGNGKYTIDGEINIKGGMIEAIGGSDNVAGIGKGDNSADIKVTITGGSVKSDINVIPTDETGKPVYKNTLTIGDPSIGDGKSVTGAEIDGNEGAYGLTDVVTSDDGKVYFWLPESDTNGSVMLEAGDQKYKEAWQRGKADNTEKTLLKNISAQEPEIQSQPTDMSLIAGDSGTLGVSANVSDGGELSFQWYKNTTNSTEGAEKINGADEYSYSPDTSEKSKYYYYVVVTNTIAGNVFEKTKSITSDIVKVLALELNETPETKIDYKNEMLTDLVPNGIYEINGLVRQADNEGKISIQEEWIGNELSIIHKGEEDKLTTDSEAQEITLESRLETPQGLEGIDETLAGENDGIIEGLNEGLKYEYSKEGDTSWKTINNSTEIADLSPGTYYVRSIPKDDNEEVFKSNSAIVEISAGIVPNRTLKIKAPVFEDITIGDKQPGAKEIEITNSGNLDVTIDSVTVKGEGFKVSGDGDKVGPQEMITSWKIQPEENLAYGTYKATIVVTYDGTEAKMAEAEVSFTINKINEINYKADGENTYKSGDYTITADGDIDKFETLLCDNTEVNKKDFSVKSGSTIATIKESYMKTLSEGEHTFTFLFEDGEANHTVKVLKENESTDTKPGANTDAKSGANTDAKSGVSGSAKTGDSASLPLWIFLMFASSALLIHSQRNRKEK